MTSNKRTPQQLIDMAVAQSETTMDAARLLEQWARKDNQLKNHLTEPWLSRACYDAVRSATRGDRSKIWTAPNYTPGGNGQRVVSHGESLLDFPLPGGMPLRHAKKADLEAAAQSYIRQGKDMISKGRWLEKIAARVGRKKVESVFDHESLSKLRDDDSDDE